MVYSQVYALSEKTVSRSYRWNDLFCVYTLYFIWLPLLQSVHLNIFTKFFDPYKVITILPNIFTPYSFTIDKGHFDYFYLHYLPAILLGLYFILPLFLVPPTIRRLRDIGWPQWLAVLVVIPVINLLATFVFSLISGREGQPAPKKQRRKDILHIFLIVLFVFLLYVGTNYIREDFGLSSVLKNFWLLRYVFLW